MNSITEKNVLLTYTKDTTLHVQSATSTNNYFTSEDSATSNTRHLERVWSPNKFNQKKSELLTLALDKPLNISWSYLKKQTSTAMEQKTTDGKNSSSTHPSPLSPTSCTSCSSSSSDTEQPTHHSTATPPTRSNKAARDGTTSPTAGSADPLSPTHHARRPMNAFLIFCKKHRPVVRRKFLSLENRAVTKILGEWWALLESGEKEAYTTLAREYKDAFFDANPDFKWYKLPAPPLRTLHTRPSTTQLLRQLATSEITSTTTNTAGDILTSMAGILSGHNTVTPSTYKEKGIGGGTSGGCNKDLSGSVGRVEFTPGKLADESQLGKLSSLLNMNSNNNIQMENSNYYSYNNNNYNTYNNNNNTAYTSMTDSSSNVITPDNKQDDFQAPSKPIKKREFMTNDQNQMDSLTSMFDISSNRNFDTTIRLNENPSHTNENVMINSDRGSIDGSRVARNLFDDEEVEGSEERKVGRKCKGKRYKEFMINGKLLKNKRDKFSEDDGDDFLQMDSNSQDNSFSRPQHIDLDTTIKMLAERTRTKLPESPHTIQHFDSTAPSSFNDSFISNGVVNTSNINDNTNRSGNSAFNLDDRIAMLPCLSYEQYVRRKRDSKKRSKFVRNRTHELMGKGNVKSMENSTVATTAPIASVVGLVGSKKRKNKQNITHLKGSCV